MRAIKLFSLILLFGSTVNQSAFACGGFFCEAIPINQAAEQIVFRTDGDSTTAMVRILYSGDAESFSWVVPVPNRPELSVGADQTFLELDLATRPRFQLERRGNSCDIETVASPSTDGATTAGAPVFEESDVSVEELSVGPFDVQIVSSDNPDELATWLTENNYDLSDNGRALIAPYVEAGMQFVALKLRSGQSTGSIQPLVMSYQSEKPVIPIRLTAVAAEEDMGVLVWFVSSARAVPENYLHVRPNYTRLNWYSGTGNAYASYQTLITAAMNEAGGQGFATDMAGAIDESFLSLLTDADFLEFQLEQVDSIVNDAVAISTMISSASTPAFQSAVETLLPLPPGQNSSVYVNVEALQTLYTAEELAQARPAIRTAWIDIEIDPLKESISLFPENAYLTRLYTTLSADEMTLDPAFVFNNMMPDQPMTRQAVLESSCGENGTEWSLTLGAGTGRDGEKVIIANADIPFTTPPEVASQASTFRIERTSATELPELTNQSDLTVVNIGDSGDPEDEDGGGFLGSFASTTLFIMLLVSILRRRFLPSN